jgi:O-succinylbenzoate synthase
VVEIVRITLREIELPLIEPFRSAGGVIGHRRILLLTLADSDGVETWSECVAEALPTYSAETVDSCWLAIVEWIAPIVLGARFESPAELHNALEKQVRGNNMARAAVEMGSWALDAERRRIPLASLLASASGFAREIRAAPRSSVETGIALGLQSNPEALVERCRDALAAGYRRIKVKIEPGRDVDYIRAFRDEFGPDVVLTADANCSYADHDGRLELLDKLDAFGLSMLEQPFGRDDLVRHAELQRRVSTRICLDESITDVSSTETMLSLRSCKVVNLKAGRVGGFSEAIAIHDMCARAGIPVWCGGMLESGIGRAYNVALASLPNFTEPGDLSPSDRYWERDIVTPAWTMDAAAQVRVPLDRPGLGIEVDAARIDDLTVRTLELAD